MPERAKDESGGHSSRCVLMFSGGRDSTLAAVRLSARFESLVLATVVSDHLIGIAYVKRRLEELKQLLPKSTRWIQVRQPAFAGQERLLAATCLPCQRSYVAAAVLVARRLGIRNIALGYSGYQSEWPEQTQLATKSLTEVLAKHGFRLHLPVYEVATKQEVVKGLNDLGLSADALEQKCLRQASNVALDGPLLRDELARWEQTIGEQLQSQTVLKIDAECTLEDLR